MTEESKDAIVGRVFREKQELELALARLRIEARRLADTFSPLSQKLRDNPESVAFDQQPIGLSYSNPTDNRFKVADIDGNKLLALTNEIRETLNRLKRINHEASTLGM